MKNDVLTFRVQLGDRGRLVLPAEVRRRLNLHTGDDLVLIVEHDGSIRMTTGHQVVRESRGMYGRRAPRRSLVDELIAERRDEARRESRR